MTSTPSTVIDAAGEAATRATTEATAAALTERLIGDAVTTMETLNVYLGVRLGLYAALADRPLDPGQLADAAGIHRRYAREWLEQQAVAGILHAVDDDTTDDPYRRLFALPAAQRQVLLDEDSPYFVGTLPGFLASIALVIPDVITAFRTGGGVPYEAYGADTRHGIGGLNRPGFLTQIADWVAALPDVHARLRQGPCRILDLGCGTGWSSIALAEAFPQCQVHGIDLDPASVAEAAGNAAARGLDSRVTVVRGDAARIGPSDAGPTGTGPYDLVCLFESLHDMADPVAVLRAAREVLSPGGAVLVGDERVADRFEAPGDLLERLNYGFSVLHCLPATRAEGTSVEAGTVLRATTVRRYAEQAGYSGFAELPIEHDLWRFYRLDLGPEA